MPNLNHILTLLKIDRDFLLTDEYKKKSISEHPTSSLI